MQCSFMISNLSVAISGTAQRIALSLAATIALGAFGLCLPATALGQQAGSSDSAQLAAGRRIYVEGILPSGAALSGLRQADTLVSGAAAACVTCHRRSGLGQVEANVQIPPIAGNYLFANPGDKRLVTMDPHVSKSFNQAHDPYTDATLAAAIRDGMNNRGKVMSEAMPRYAIKDTELQALTAYLRHLSAEWSPGVSATSIRFATVITPDLEPARRKVLVDMIRTVVRQKNSSTKLANQGRTRHHMTSAAELILGTERNWELEFWELQGAPETWGEQLAARQRSNPVFALLSGASAGTWQPVHDFCDREQVPCWFPSVEVPGKQTSPYAFYFSGGVTLEAAVLARHLRDQAQPPRHVVQIFRDGEVGRSAAQTLASALAGSGIATTERMVRPDLPAVDALRLTLGKLKPDDQVMFWLGPADVEALGKIDPVAGKHYFSVVLAQGEHALLSPQWRKNAALIYPYELPENRLKNLDYFYTWLNLVKIPLVDEAMQSEVFFSLNFMTDTLSEMLDNVYRDYLIDRAESMLSIREGMKSAQETRDRVALGRAGDLAKRHGASTMDERLRIQASGHEIGTGVSHGTTLYPHLSLGPDQRFASKSGYIVRFADDKGIKLITESALIVP